MKKIWTLISMPPHHPRLRILLRCSVFWIFSAYSPLNSANSSLFSELTLVWLVVGYQLREAKRVCILCRKAHFLWTASSFTAEHSGFFLGCAHLLIAYHFWDWLSNFEEMVRQCQGSRGIRYNQRVHWNLESRYAGWFSIKKGTPKWINQRVIKNHHWRPSYMHVGIH